MMRISVAMGNGENEEDDNVEVRQAYSKAASKWANPRRYRTTPTLPKAADPGLSKKALERRKDSALAKAKDGPAKKQALDAYRRRLEELENQKKSSMGDKKLPFTNRKTSRGRMSTGLKRY
jgi:hypothetical protein